MFDDFDVGILCVFAENVAAACFDNFSGSFIYDNISFLFGQGESCLFRNFNIGILGIFTKEIAAAGFNNLSFFLAEWLLSVLQLNRCSSDCLQDKWITVPEVFEPYTFGLLPEVAQLFLQ